MLREAHHRMKNTLALLGASARREFGRGASADLLAAVDSFEQRVVAFGRLYRVLESDGDDQHIAVPEFFEALCKALSDSMLGPAGICCELAIEEGKLPSDQCHRLALVITELVTNAAKHAFPTGSGGIISVKMFSREGRWYCSVADNGLGANGGAPGAGIKILEALCRSINADIRIEANEAGTTVKISLLPKL
jgi:two-component sensor histidine kinase